jgi:hypothetical protein
LKTQVQNKIADNHNSMVEVYKEVDLLNPDWQIPPNEVDVHMVAIATKHSSTTKGGTALKNDKSLGPDDDGVEPGDKDFGFDDDYLTDDEYRRDLSYTPAETGGQRRKAVTSDISPKKTWTIFNAPLGFCDGSAQSRCNRNVFNPCLLANFNHYRAGIIGHGSSGKLSLSIPNVREGIILARFDWSLDDGPRVKYLPPDFQYILTVNGQTTTQNRQDFANSAIDLLDDLRLHVLMMNKDMSHTDQGDGKTIDVDIEIIAKSTADKPKIYLSHIYYA